MRNPISNDYQNGKQVGVLNADRIADTTASVRQGFNTFDLSQHTFATYKYGEIQPFWSMEAVPGDHLSIRNEHNVNTFTFSSPLLSDVRMNTDYFAVPMNAIMPYTWDMIIVDPKKGNDVPEDALPKFDIDKFYNDIYGFIQDNPTSEGEYDHLLKAALLIVKVFSGGSLLENLNFHSRWSQNVDDALTAASSALQSGHIKVKYDDFVDGEVVHKDRTFKFGTDLSETRGAFLDLLYFDETWAVDTTDTVTKNTITAFIDLFGTELLPGSLTPNYINLSKIVAYQQICCQFYTNDNVDYVFTAEDYMDIQKNLFTNKLSAASVSFKYNGLNRSYDFISKKILDSMLTTFIGNGYNDAYSFFSNIFDVRRSLKYGDYFLSARVRPLAVGDVSIGVDQPTMTVSAIDVTRNIAIQRFLNAVNRAGNVIESYMQNIFGEKPTDTKPQPHFVGHSVDTVGKAGTTNTGADQGITTVNMNASGSDYSFDVKIKGEYCILLGLVSFDCEYAYATTTARDWRHADRFDHFNPMLQSIGDQPIMYEELKDTALNDKIFAYDQRYGEYKRAYNYAAGGFLSNAENGNYKHGLSTWLFIPENQSVVRFDETHLSPEFIRSTPKDFDKFYKSLTGNNIRDYYHFIADFHNIVKANRKMEYQPGILEG